MGKVRRFFRALSKFTGVIAILNTIGLICLALVWGMMLNGNPYEIIISTWMALSLTKYIFNAILVIFVLFNLNSRSIAEKYPAFLLASLGFTAWNIAVFPHKLAIGFFLFWASYSCFLVANRKRSDDPGPEEANPSDGPAREGA